ncbi:hypothetical protein OS493_040439, partial [Desmophyllum pertusum]
NAYTCEGCERMYTSINFLQRHKNYHCSCSRTYTKCEKCNTEFQPPVSDLQTTPFRQ